MKSMNNEKHGTFNQKWSVEEQVSLLSLYRLFLDSLQKHIYIMVPFLRAEGLFFSVALYQIHLEAEQLETGEQTSKHTLQITEIIKDHEDNSYRF